MWRWNGICSAQQKKTRRESHRALDGSGGGLQCVHCMNTVKDSNVRRPDNKLAYAYILTRAGIEEKGRLTKFAAQTERV